MINRLFQKADIPHNKYHLFIVLQYSGLLALLAHMVFIIIFKAINVPFMFFFNFGSCILFVGCFLLVRKGLLNTALIIATVEVLAHAILSVRFIGWNSGFHIYIVCILPLYFFHPFWPLSVKLVLSFLLCGIYILLNTYTPVAGWVPVNPETLTSIRHCNFFAFFTILSGFSFYYGLAARHSENKLRAQNLELEQAHAVIRQEIEERNRAMEAHAKVEAQLSRARKMEAIGMLAGGVAHDLNNILSGIVSYPELLLMDLPEESQLRGPIETIKESGEKASTIVQDLLTLARRGVAVTEVLKLNRIIYDYLSGPVYRKLKFFHPNVRIETSLDENILNLNGSPVHLSKTVMNLISNAAEAMPDGGLITITTENRYIDKSLLRYDEISEGDYVILQVRDSGIGISAEDQERIFEPFYTKKVMGRSGTGLGMAVIWGTIKDHCGYIDVKSIEGQGTAFTLYFPATRQEISAQAADNPIETIKGHGESILVVDDVKEQREISSVMLGKLGYEVYTAVSGEEAVSFLKSTKVDLLVLDMIMDPGIDGLETYKQVLQIQPDQKAIIASGFSETRRVRAAQELGAGEYVKKPYTLQKIGTAVKAELSG